MLKLEPTQTSYYIGITVAQMDLMDASEGWRWDGPVLNELSFNDLPDVHGYEYDDHLGGAIYLMIGIEGDNPETHQEISDIITNFFDDVEKYINDTKLSKDEQH